MRSIVLLIGLLTAGSASGQTTWYVDLQAASPGNGTLQSPYTQIQAALAAPGTADGDTIRVAPGVYAEQIDFLGKSVVLRSSGGAALTAIDAGGAGSVVTVASGESSGTQLDGFTLQNGAGTDVGGMRLGGGLFLAASSLVVRNSKLAANTAHAGGGAYVEGAALLLANTAIEDNTTSPFDFSCQGRQASHGAGLYASAASTVLANGLAVERNTGPDALGAGVAIVDSSMTWAGGLLKNNVTESFGCIVEGGGLYCLNAYCSLADVKVEANSAFGVAAEGGGISAHDTNGTWKDCTFVANRAGEPLDFIFDFPGHGGGASIPTGSIALERCSFVDNIAWFDGGGLRAGSGVQVSDSLFLRNTSQFGGGAEGSASYSNCVFAENTANSPSGTAHFGGATSGPATLANCLLRDNLAYGDGGGAHGGTLTNCVLLRNTALGRDMPGKGGGAWGATLQGGRVVQNVCFGNGGGLSECTATRSVIAKNEASELGGGAHASSLFQCTLAQNRVPSTGAPAAGGGVAQCTVESSILWDNVPDAVAVPKPSEFYGPSTLAWCDVQGGFQGQGNFAGDPLFWQASALDFHLRAGSPCIDAGMPALQDPDGSPIEAGALTYDPAWCPSAVIYCTAKTDSQGCVPSLSASGALDGQLAFPITASQVLNEKSGLFFYGLSGRAAIPFLGGTLCAKAPLRRTPLQSSGGTSGALDCTGTLSFDLGAWIAAGKDPGIVPGTQVQGQFWYRDPAAPQGTGLSNAIEVVRCQ